MGSTNKFGGRGSCLRRYYNRKMISVTNGVWYFFWGGRGQRLNFKMAAMSSFQATKCCHLADAHEASAIQMARCLTVASYADLVDCLDDVSLFASRRHNTNT